MALVSTRRAKNLVAQRLGNAEMHALAPGNMVISLLAAVGSDHVLSGFVFLFSFLVSLFGFYVPGYLLRRYPIWGWAAQPLAAGAIGFMLVTAGFGFGLG